MLYFYIHKLEVFYVNFYLQGVMSVVNVRPSWSLVMLVSSSLGSVLWHLFYLSPTASYCFDLDHFIIILRNKFCYLSLLYLYLPLTSHLYQVNTVSVLYIVHVSVVRIRQLFVHLFLDSGSLTLVHLSSSVLNTIKMFVVKIGYIF